MKLKRNSWTLFGSPDDTPVIEVYPDSQPDTLASYWTLGLDEYGTADPLAASHWSECGEVLLGTLTLDKAGPFLPAIQKHRSMRGTKALTKELNAYYKAHGMLPMCALEAQHWVAAEERFRSPDGSLNQAGVAHIEYLEEFSTLWQFAETLDI